MKRFLCWLFHVLVSWGLALAIVWALVWLNVWIFQLPADRAFALALVLGVLLSAAGVAIGWMTFDVHSADARAKHSWDMTKIDRWYL